MKHAATIPLLALTSATLFALLPAPATAANASAGNNPTHAATPERRVRFDVNARLRYEHVDDDAFARPADATTLRLRAGMHLQLAQSLSALVEGEGVLATDDTYNSGANGRGAYPAVIDPQGAEINQAWLRWQSARAAATLGRQRLLFDNQRWVGNVGWRQNEQTYDAVAAQWTPVPALTFRYAWLDRVHRVNGDAARDVLARERRLDTHLFNLHWQHDAQQLGGYAWLHEDRDVATASTATVGARWSAAPTAATHGWGWTLEAARQREHGNNPQHFRHDYWLFEPSLATGPVTWRAGWEHLGGDGRHALQTPLATLHAFDGWADKFLVTPPRGLEDRYLGAGGKFAAPVGSGQWNWALAWHDFVADRGGDRYGREWDASLGMPLSPALNGLVKIADYRSDGFARDTRKLWLQLEWTH